MHEFNLIYTVLTILAVMGALQGTCAMLILLERRLAAFVQDRLGPNRVGPFGLLQPLADGLKFLLKEEVIPGHVDKALFLLAPTIAMAVSTIAFVVVPFGATEPQPAIPNIQKSGLALEDVKQLAQQPSAVHHLGWGDGRDRDCGHRGASRRARAAARRSPPCSSTA